MADVTIYTTQLCPYCVRAKMLLNSKGVAFHEIAVDFDSDKRREMMSRSGRTSVPQIWVDETHVGGCDELYMMERQGKLDGLLGVAS